MKSGYMVAGFILLVASNAYGAGLDTKQMRYDEYRFSHPSLAADRQAGQFKVDATACDKDAQQAFEEEMKHRDALSDLYGVPINREVLLEKKKAIFLLCMVGDTKGKFPGKGWVAKKEK